MPSKLNEKILLYKLLTERDPEAFAALYDIYLTRIYRFVYFKVSSHEEAEDLTSEVFLKTWHYIQEKREVESFSGLLYRIARNCIIDLYRQKASKPEIFTDEEIDASDEGKWLGAMNVKAENQQLFIALKKLKQEYQEVLTLKYIDELEIDEISAITEKGRVAVRVTLHRALKKLREIIDVEVTVQ